MSTSENDRIFEAALERAQEEGMDEEVIRSVLSEYPIEDIQRYLATGKLPGCYKRKLYIENKCSEYY